LHETPEIIKGEDRMLLAVSRTCRLVLVCGAIVSIHAWQGIAQDPLPVPETQSEVSSDDPIMKAIQERAALVVPAKGSSAWNPSKTPSPTRRKPADRWRIAERLLRQARIIERDADSLEQLDDGDAAEALRQLAVNIREQVVRILQTGAKPPEEKREQNPPLNKTTP
jgi:hypothetical protein